MSVLYLFGIRPPSQPNGVAACKNPDHEKEEGRHTNESSKQTGYKIISRSIKLITHDTNAGALEDAFQRSLSDPYFSSASTFRLSQRLIHVSSMYLSASPVPVGSIMSSAMKYAIGSPMSLISKKSYHPSSTVEYSFISVNTSPMITHFSKKCVLLICVAPTLCDTFTLCLDMLSVFYQTI